MTHALLGEHGQDDAAEDLAAWGADDETVKRCQEAHAEVWVLPENWDAATLFSACGTQWRTAGVAGVATGLDYAGVDVVMRRRGFADEVFEQLEAMERTALEYWASRR